MLDSCGDYSLLKIQPRRWLWLARRSAFTLSLLVLLGGVAVLSCTIFLRVSPEWLARLGFAPSDLLSKDWHHLVTSAALTGGGKYFWQALFMVAVAYGLTEWTYGTPRAFLAFWGLHCGTLLIESVVMLFPMRLWNAALAAVLAGTRDTGPSNSYFGCLGLIGMRLRRPWNRLFIGITALVLLGAFFRAPHAGQNSFVKMTADVGHVIAFPLGCLLSILLRPRAQGQE